MKLLLLSVLLSLLSFLLLRILFCLLSGSKFDSKSVSVRKLKDWLDAAQKKKKTSYERKKRKENKVTKGDK